MERGRVSLTGYGTWSKTRQLTKKFQMYKRKVKLNFKGMSEFQYLGCLYLTSNAQVLSKVIIRLSALIQVLHVE